MQVFKGAGVAIVTPMKDNEEVNYDKLEELINIQIDAGTDAIIIVGTTGEGSTLSMEEHRYTIKKAVEFVKGRIRHLLSASLETRISLISAPSGSLYCS